MPKSINWPEEYLNEYLSEPMNENKIALRLGNLYYDTKYYVKNDVVDIRINHKIKGKAKIIKELELCKIKDLSELNIKCYKSNLNSKDNIINFLSSNYNKPVNEHTEVTIITYINIINDNELTEDPHL